MRILLDAQLPRSLVRLLETQVCDTLHTFDLPEGNRSSDDSISAKADQDERVVFSKDKDFIQSHLLIGSPRKLLLITTGNISNQELASLLLRSLSTLRTLFESHALIELQRLSLIVRS